MQRKHAILGLVAACAVVAAGLAILRTNATISQRTEEFASSAAKFREITESIPVSLSADDPGVYRHLLAQCKLPQEMHISEARREALASTVGEFLARRFGSSNAAEYAAWMKAQGFGLLSVEELESTWHIDDAFRIYGARRPEGADSEQLWLAAWGAAEGAPKRTMSVQRLPAREDGYSVAIGRITLANPVWPHPDDPVYQSMAHSGSLHTSLPWWRHPRGWQEQLESRGEAIVAHVSVLGETAGGARGTVCLSYVLDPVEENWLLQSVSSDMPLRLEY